MSFELILESMKDPAADLAASELHEVSDLSPEELGRFTGVWVTLPAERQRDMLSAMTGLAEQNAELDFSPIFKTCLKASEYDEVLAIAIEGLWEHEDRSIIPGLIEVLNSDRSAMVRAVAAQALGKFPVLAQEGKLLAKDGDLVYESLLGPLEDEDEYLEVRRRCLESIAPFNTDDIEGYVIWAFNSEDQDLKSSSIYAMGRTGEVAWLPTLIQELGDSDPAVRYETAQACGELGEEGAVLHLVDLLEDEDSMVQLAGIAALGKIGGPLAKRVLLDCASRGDDWLEDAAKAELENIEFLEDPLNLYDS